jgi:hypothetical protein
MAANKILFAVVTVVCSSLIAFADISVRVSDLPVPPYTYTSASTGFEVECDLGSNGQGQVWAFGDQEWLFHRTAEILPPSAASYSGDFPEANRVTRISNPETPSLTQYVYERADNNGCYYEGCVRTSSRQTVTIHCTPAALAMPLPLSYGSTWLRVERYETLVRPNWISTSIDSFSNVVDGAGILQTPFGRYEVLRVFTHARHLEQDRSGFLVDVRSLWCTWYDQRGLPIVQIQSAQALNIEQFTLGYIEMLEVPLAATLPKAVTADFALQPNYPNPFNPETVIPFSLDKTARVHLEVFDLSGRCVGTLADEILPAGNYRRTFHASTLPSGTYLCRLQAENHSQIQRMTLLK